MNDVQHFHAFEICDHPGLPFFNCPGDLVEIGSFDDAARRPGGGMVLRTVTVHRCDACRHYVSIAVEPGRWRPVILNDHLPPADAGGAIGPDPRD